MVFEYNSVFGKVQFKVMNEFFCFLLRSPSTLVVVNVVGVGGSLTHQIGPNFRNFQKYDGVFGWPAH